MTDQNQTTRSPFLAACDVPPSEREADLMRQRAHLTRQVDAIDAESRPLREARTNAWRRKINEMMSQREGYATHE